MSVKKHVFIAHSDCSQGVHVPNTRGVRHRFMCMCQVHMLCVRSSRAHVLSLLILSPSFTRTHLTKGKYGLQDAQHSTRQTVGNKRWLYMHTKAQEDGKDAVTLHSAAVEAFKDRSFFLDTLSGVWQSDEFVTRLKNLGAIVQQFLDVEVHCVVTTLATTPSAPSTPTGQLGHCGVSQRARQMMSKSVSRQLTTSAQFATIYHKQILSPQELDARLTAAETSQQQQNLKKGTCLKARPEEADGTGGHPTAPRHSVRVRGVDTEFCKRGPGVPEWWHFPEEDRPLYCPPEDLQGATTGVHPTGKKKEFGVSKGATPHKRLGGLGGFCSLCRVKHDNAKLHADSSAHHRVVLALLASGSDLVKEPRPFIVPQRDGP